MAQPKECRLKYSNVEETVALALSNSYASDNSITLSVNPDTDIFASPKTGYTWSSPIAYVALKTEDFGTAKATISVPYTLSSKESSSNPTLQFDQAGILLALPHPKHACPTKDQPGTGKVDASLPHPKWVKIGAEVWEGNGYGSVVVRDKWSDWSLFEIEEAQADVDENVPALKATFELERMDAAMMIYRIKPDRSRVPVRKVPWWFLEGETQETMWVGIYGARPDPFRQAEGKALEVQFHDFEVKDKAGSLLV